MLDRVDVRGYLGRKWSTIRCPVCDLNGDGRVDERDKTIVKTFLDDPDISPLDCRVADLDGDGKVNKKDWKLFIRCYDIHSGADELSDHS